MEDMPIDIHYNKLSDWLIKRRHCKLNWQEQAMDIRGKINTAIQDMPAHEDITSLLAGTYINYFHCLRIIEILKTTEASSKNIFGSYSSQRMKDWQEVVQLYKVDCVYLAEAAQMLTRNVNYELPALKKQVMKCTKAQQDSVRKEAEYNNLASDLRSKYTDMCQQIGVQGKQVKKELLSLAANLPETFDQIAEEMRELKSGLRYYSQFTEYINPGGLDSDVCCLLQTVIDKGNISTYEWRTGRTPVSLIEACIAPGHGAEDTVAADTQHTEIDWGAIDFDEGSANTAEEIDYGYGDIQIEVNEAGNAELTIEWPDEDEKEAGSADGDDGVARGKDALSVFDNPSTRFQLCDELIELQSFLSQRLEELQAGTDVIVMSVLQSAPLGLQLSDKELSLMLSKVSAINVQLSSSKLQQLMSIRNSPRYVERITENITKVRDQADKMAASARLMVIKREEAAHEEKETKPKINLIKQKTLELKKQVEKDISTKYKSRVVNIMGEINSM